MVSGIVLAWMLARCPGAVALNPAFDVSQYAHTSWKIRDGFSKGTIFSIAQTPDGYLWLGTELGILRFDGVRPVPWQPPSGQQLPSNNIRALRVTRDGTLWMGTEAGLASWKDGRLSRYEPLAGRMVMALVEDREGSLWATTFFNLKLTLCQIRRADAKCYGDDGGPGVGAIKMFEDSAGRLWVGTAGAGNGVWRWKPGPPQFYPLPQQPNGVQGFGEDGDGVLLVSLSGGVARFVDGEPEIAYGLPPVIRQFQFPVLLRDRDGSLWLGGTNGGGLVHFHQGMADTFASPDGLSGSVVVGMFEDREGNIWVATTEGLDRFGEIAVATYSVKQGLMSASVDSVLAAQDGSIWLGTSVGLDRWDHGHVTSRWRPADVNGVGSIFQDSLGRVWLSTEKQAGYLEGGRFVSLPGPRRGLVRWIAEDADANVWIATRESGLVRFSLRTGDIQSIPWTNLNQTAMPVAVAADRSLKGVWLGFSQGPLLYFADGQVRSSYGSAEGIADGLRGFQLDRDGTLWAATDAGLSRVKNGRVATLTVKNGLPCDGVEWLVEDDDRAFWLGTRCGLVRVARTDLTNWVASVDTEHGVARAIKTTVFDSTDGVRTYIGGTYSSRPAAKASDGRLWFISQGGVSVVNPRSLPHNNLPPPVRIEQIVADQDTYDAGAVAAAGMHLPALTRDLRFDYTALSFVAPERVAFRYKLEGFDRDWQNVGARRQAFYNNLSPGTYRFRVIAANNSGVWNDTGDSLEFSIAPAYYQTSWFLALSVASIIALMWTAHRVRLRIVERHQREISALNERTMKAQEQERIRIAGELHDGVMQEMLAATMMLGSAKRRISDSPDAAKAALDKVQQKLIQAGTDLRQLSHDLHPPLLQESGLHRAVQAYCEQFTSASGIPIECHADDSVRELSRGAALALFRIVQEALGNAAKHANARRITVRLTRASGDVTLAVSDDGVGLDRTQLATGGGLGLVMMRERATQLNGTFDFETVPGRGTTIRVTIPFR